MSVSLPLHLPIHPYLNFCKYTSIVMEIIYVIETHYSIFPVTNEAQYLTFIWKHKRISIHCGLWVVIVRSVFCYSGCYTINHWTKLIYAIKHHYSTLALENVVWVTYRLYTGLYERIWALCHLWAIKPAERPVQWM